MKAQNLRDKLSQWDSQLAPLSSRQKDGYLQLSAAATSRPLPTQTQVVSLDVVVLVEVTSRFIKVYIDQLYI